MRRQAPFFPPRAGSSSQMSGNLSAPSMSSTRASSPCGMNRRVLILFLPISFSHSAHPGMKLTRQAKPSFAAKRLTGLPPCMTYSRSGLPASYISTGGAIRGISRAFLYHSPAGPMSAAIAPRLPFVMMCCHIRAGSVSFTSNVNFMSSQLCFGTESALRRALSSASRSG